MLHFVITENDKCPPWSIQASEMLHDRKKTIYYDNAVIKVYDIPIFYLPGFLILTQLLTEDQDSCLLHLEDSKNLGAGVSIPYFWAVKNDKNFTVTINFIIMKIHYSWENTTKHSKILAYRRLWLYKRL